MRWIILACLFCLTASQPALAGAWLRDKGKGFFAYSSTLYVTPQIYPALPLVEYDISIYADYGLTSWLTMGIDVFEQPDFGGHTLLFMRLPISASERPSKFAFELAIGGHHQNDNWNPMYRAGLSWGYGFNNWFGPGWMAVDTAVEYIDGHSKPLLKVDAALGLSSPNRIRPMLQVETAVAQDLPLIWKLTPSLMIPGKGKSTWVIGVQQRSFGTPRTGLKLALWRKF
ncbi:MAG: hypothetical protein KUG62_01835 [Rhodobacteraceae bacterium]|nr:hypothetical protein [Paracoccaceae bacterium]